MRDHRGGFALTLTLWALVIAAALLTVAVFVGFHEQRAAGNARRLEQALTRAESALSDGIVGWTPGLLNRRLPQPFDSLLTGVAGGDVIHRLGDGLFLSRATGSDTGAAGAPRGAAIATRVGLQLGVHPLRFEARAALTSAGDVFLGDGATVSGLDEPPPEWPDCPPGDGGVAGVAAESVAVTGSAQVTGLPDVRIRQIDDTESTLRDSITYDSLASQATVQVPPGVWQTPPFRVGPECDTGPPLNWGDPSSPDAVCGGYLPIIHVAGDLTLVGGEGQGILLVDGNLDVSGPYRFFGLLLTRGRLDLVAPIMIRGAVLASEVATESQPAAGATVSFSKCILDRVLRTSGRLIPLRSRSWKQLFEVP